MLAWLVLCSETRPRAQYSITRISWETYTRGSRRIAEWMTRSVLCWDSTTCPNHPTRKWRPLLLMLYEYEVKTELLPSQQFLPLNAQLGNAWSWDHQMSEEMYDNSKRRFEKSGLGMEHVDVVFFKFLMGLASRIIHTHHVKRATFETSWHCYQLLGHRAIRLMTTNCYSRPMVPRREC